MEVNPLTSVDPIAQVIPFSNFRSLCLKLFNYPGYFFKVVFLSCKLHILAQYNVLL